MDLGRGDRELRNRTTSRGEGASNGGAGYEPRADWHVMLDGKLLGPLTQDELVEVLRARPGTADAPVWCEGDEAWAPVREIPELVAAMRAAKRTPSSRPPAAPRASVIPAPAVPPFASRGEGRTSGMVDVSALLAEAARAPEPRATPLPAELPALPAVVAPSALAVSSTAPGGRARGEVFLAGALLGACFVGAVAIAASSARVEPSSAPVARRPEPLVAARASEAPRAALPTIAADAPAIAVAPAAPERTVEVVTVPSPITIATPRPHAPEVRRELPESDELDAEPEPQAPPVEVTLAAATGEPADTTEVPAEPAPAQPELAVASHDGTASLDSLIEAAVGADARSTPAPEPVAAAEELPDAPNRDDVDRVLARLHPAVTACGEIGHGTAVVRITTAGPSGRVTSAIVEGALTGTPAGSCVARAVRTALFPRFARETFTVVYPFRI